MNVLILSNNFPPVVGGISNFTQNDYAMKSFINTILILLVITIPAGMFMHSICHAQSKSAALTLEESVSFGLKNSFRMKIYKQELDRSRKYAEAARAGLKSYMDLTTNLPYYSNEVEGIKDIDGVTYYAFSRNLKYQSTLSFHQPLPTSGHLSLNYDFYYHQQKNEVENYSNDLFIRFNQPIFTSNNVKRGIRWAEIDYERSRARFIDRRFDYTQDVISQFYRFYRSDMELKIQEEEIQQRKISYEDAKTQFENGNLEEFELLNLEVELLKSEALYYDKKTRRDRRASYFKELTGIPHDIQITPIADLRYTPIEINDQKALDLSLENSPNIVSALYYIESQRLFTEYVDTWSEFRGNILFTYGLEKVDPIFRNSYRGFDQSRSVIINLSFPLWDWGRQKGYKGWAKARVNSAELYLLMQQQNVSQNTRNTVRRARVTLRRLDNLKNTEKQAQRSYELAREKFLQRNLSGNELILTMEQWSSARNRFIDAYIDYEISKAELRRVTQWDFEKNEKVEPLDDLSQP